MQYFDAI